MATDSARHRLLIGAGGSGKSTALRSWVSAGTKAVWLSGDPYRLITPNNVDAAIGQAPEIIVADELQWFSSEAVDRLIEVVEQPSTPSIFASKRPWPTSPSLRYLSTLLTADNSAETAGFVGPEKYRPTLAKMLNRPISAELANWFYHQTGGSLGLTADIVSTSWHEQPELSPPAELTYVISQRIERNDPAVTAVLRALIIAPAVSLSTAAKACGDDQADKAELGVKACGLCVDDGVLLPIVSATASTLSSSDQTKIFDQLALYEPNAIQAAEYALRGSGNHEAVGHLLADTAQKLWWTDPANAVTYLKAANKTLGSNPERQLLLHVCAYRIGDRNLTLDAENVDGVVGFNHTVQDLRWLQAKRHVDPNSAAGVLVALLQGEALTEPKVFDHTEGNQMITALRMLAAGQHTEAITTFATTAADHDRRRHAEPSDPVLVAFTPHRIGVLAASSAGDIKAAQVLTRKAMTSPALTPAEQRTFELLGAYLKLVRGDYREALQATNGPDQNPDATWAARDQLVWAALHSGLARRSGDTDRLRQAWERTEPVLLQVTPSWIYTEVFHDLLVAGARLGHVDRIQPHVEHLTTQSTNLSEAAQVNAAWLELQVGVATKTIKEVTAATDRLQTIAKKLPRSRSRADASAVWNTILQGGTVNEKHVTTVADELAHHDDPWQASRLLGQAALDQPDPKTARRLLERARSLVAELGDPGVDDFAEWGLSERESEIARLVAQGYAYKQIGERLYISPKTVEHHVAKIRQKVGANSRAEMLRKINSRMSEQQ